MQSIYICPVIVLRMSFDIIIKKTSRTITNTSKRGMKKTSKWRCQIRYASQRQRRDESE